VNRGAEVGKVEELNCWTIYTVSSRVPLRKGLLISKVNKSHPLDKATIRIILMVIGLITREKVFMRVKPMNLIKCLGN